MRIGCLLAAGALVASLGAGACGGSLQAEVRPTPLAVSLSWEGEPPVTVGGAGKGALYVTGWAGRQDLVGARR